jgi:L-rhamnose mutarotase
MSFYGRTVDLKDDPNLIEAYKEYHRNVWPEVEEQLRKLGVTKMRIFLLGRHLFMYMEAPDTFDPDAFDVQWLEEPRCVAWEEIMEHYFAPLPEARPGEWWLAMEPIYDFTTSPGVSPR